MTVPAFTPTAPITYIIDQITSLVSAALDGVAGNLITTISPLVSAVFGVYIIFLMFNYMRGATPEPLMDLLALIVKWSLIISFGLNAEAYSSTILPIVTGLGGDLANAVSGGTVSANSLDTLGLAYLKIIDDGFAAASNLGALDKIAGYIFVGLKTIVIVFTLVPFLVAATLAIIVANVGSMIIAALAPIFFSFLLFPATRQYFSSWLNSLISYALNPILIAVVSMVGVGISAALIASDGGGQSLVDIPFSQVFTAGIGNLVLLFLLKQVSSLASALSSGGISAPGAGGLGGLASVIRESGMKSHADAKQLERRPLKNPQAAGGGGSVSRKGG
ncbi:type IV secretion system protein [Sulfuriferula nivalis]|uniref:Type IV secretion system protein n=1 Tax=Sulfuriferula nivalis TaxID=2675298 RepID=A0A809SAF9_9PROT|nr:type IV secretion system protein [Sulfuriferula nivalis]BBP01582.1 hypothetical protein SFSGTM_22900 [Sulfuriferula nivalis]